ncbi:Zinc finger protein [Fagus crenata]
MVFPMLALAKLQLLSPSHSLSPMVTSLVWPFLLKMSFSFRIVRGAYTDLVLASRLFFFQLGQIALNPEPAFGNTTRLERALRLVYQRVIRTTRSQAPPLDDDDSFHTLSMFAL